MQGDRQRLNQHFLPVSFNSQNVQLIQPDWPPNKYRTINPPSLHPVTNHRSRSQTSRSLHPATLPAAKTALLRTRKPQQLLHRPAPSSSQVPRLPDLAVPRPRFQEWPTVHFGAVDELVVCSSQTGGYGEGGCGCRNRLLCREEQGRGEGFL